jgi:hypothetical protein
MCSISPSLILGSLLFTGAGRILWLCPTGERWMALSRTTLLLAAMAVALTMSVLCGCQSDKQGGSNSSKSTGQAQTAEQTQQTQGGDLGQAQSELGPKVEKIMGSSFYRYAEWGLPRGGPLKR